MSVIRSCVESGFNGFTDGLEGKCPWMYLDVRGLVTTGRGNLIDPTAAGLPWVHRDMVTPATDNEVADEWRRVKALQSLKVRGGYAFASVTNLRLTEAAIDALCAAKLETIAAALLERFPGFAGWPADAQLGALSMAWAMGSGFPAFYPHFSAAAEAQDFRTCADECRISNGTNDRNASNQTLFANAEIVALNPAAYDRDTLYFPRKLAA